MLTYEYKVLLRMLMPLLLLLCVGILPLLLLLLFVMVHLPSEVFLHKNSSIVVLTTNPFSSTNENSSEQPLAVQPLLFGLPILYPSHGHYGHTLSRRRASAHRGEAPLYIG